MARVVALPAARPLIPRSLWRYLLFLLLLAGVGFLTAYPTALIFMRSFQETRPGEAVVWGLQGWEAAFAESGIRDALFTTLWLSAARLSLETLFAIFFAWVVTRTDTPLKGLIEFLLWLGFFLPSLPILLGWVILLDPYSGLLNKTLISAFPFLPDPPLNLMSYGGIIWVHLGSSAARRFFLITPAFRALDAALEETARMSGASNLRTIARITVPILTPTLFAVTALGFVSHLESFETELVLGFPVGIRVYSTKIWEFLHWDPPRYPEATAMSSLFLVVIFAMVWLQGAVLGRRQYTTITGRGYSPRPTSLGPWRWATFGFCMLFISVHVFVPLAFLIMGTFQKAYGYFNIPEPWTTRNWTSAFDDPTFMRSLWNTLLIGVVTGISGAFIYALITYLLVRAQLVGKSILELFLWLPWPMPGILMSLALVWLFLGTPVFLPIYGTIWALIIALVIGDAPMTSRILRGSLMQVHTDLEEAARVSGASWLYTFRRVVVPLIAPAMVAVALYNFISAVRTISSIVLLASFDSRTLSLLMLDYIIGGEREKATVIGVFLIFIISVAAIIGRSVGLRVGPPRR